MILVKIDGKEFLNFFDALDYIYAKKKKVKIQVIHIFEKEGTHNVEIIGEYDIKSEIADFLPNREGERSSSSSSDKSSKEKEYSKTNRNNKNSLESSTRKKDNQNSKSKSLDIRTRLPTGTPVIIDKVWKFKGKKYVKVVVGERPRYYELYPDGYKIIEIKTNKPAEDMPYDEKVYNIIRGAGI